MWRSCHVAPYPSCFQSEEEKTRALAGSDLRLTGYQIVASFTVNTLVDGHDAQIGDGFCDTNLSQGGSQCSLRAA